MTHFEFNEKHLSQIPALQFLIGLGFEYLSPEKARKERKERKGKLANENRRISLMNRDGNWNDYLDSGTKWIHLRKRDKRKIPVNPRKPRSDRQQVREIQPC